MARRYELKTYHGYISNLPQLEIVDTGLEVVAGHQLTCTGEYPTAFLLDLRDL